MKEDDSDDDSDDDDDPSYGGGKKTRRRKKRAKVAQNDTNSPPVKRKYTKFVPGALKKCSECGEEGFKDNEETITHWADKHPDKEPKYK